ncbi:hypothetical protein JCM6882_007217 [Rhodosporidiobolus microsporus]
MSTSTAPNGLRTMRIDWAAQDGDKPSVALGKQNDAFCLVWANEEERQRRGGAWATDLSVLADIDPFPGFGLNGSQMIWVKTYSENQGLLPQLERAGWVRAVGSALKQGLTTLPLAEVVLKEAEIAQRCALCETFESVETETRFKRCSKCRRRFYCSTEHQHQHWDAHKKDCKLLAKGQFGEVEQRRREQSYNPALSEVDQAEEA